MRRISNKAGSGGSAKRYNRAQGISATKSHHSMEGSVRSSTLYIVSVVALIAIFVVILAVISLSSTASHRAPVVSGNYTSISQLSSMQAEYLQNMPNVTATYLFSSTYPSYLMPNAMSYSTEVVTYMRDGNNLREDIMAPGLASRPNYTGVMEQFDINGAEYICTMSFSLVYKINTSYTCINGGDIDSAFVNLQNRTFVTSISSNNIALGLMYQLSFRNATTVYNDSYSTYNATYNATYFHASLFDPSDTSIHGNVSVYTSSEYGIPVSYVLNLDDPAYNASDNVITMDLRLMNVSPRVNQSKMVPQYLANFIKGTV